ncbi:sigma-70 family RNA polymerase sigma factor [Faecalibacterium prausnitzii]|uniref:sigma-70 family RNA polymerase sigma factor n=1 Tax=Faecalibacterium prausnitzii TaxID=853 RepID=UPI003F1ABC36
MTEKDWAAILKAEDRIIANSDRRFRYHCYSLESMSEELTYQERSSYIQEDFTLQLFVEDFTDTIQNEKLVKGLRCLTYRQRYAIELAFWKGYQYKEIAVILGCSPAAVTLLLQRAFRRLLHFLEGLSLLLIGDYRTPQLKGDGNFAEKNRQRQGQHPENAALAFTYSLKKCRSRIFHRTRRTAIFKLDNHGTI